MRFQTVVDSVNSVRQIKKRLPNITFSFKIILFIISLKYNHTILITPVHSSSVVDIITQTHNIIISIIIWAVKHGKRVPS